MEKIELNSEINDLFIEAEPLTVSVPGEGNTGMCWIKISTAEHESLAEIVLSVEAATAFAAGVLKIAEASKK